jgi:hypothetical protein
MYVAMAKFHSPVIIVVEALRAAIARQHIDVSLHLMMLTLYVVLIVKKQI